uniref:Flavinylation-associated cytochrome domain-containing protein n=1 Tax=Candidatus Kentrum eta TaxID=2126337 RepID=A0A450UUY6_9GAMM|nr:MAG: protein of unknown function (DUF4405) [Candidatus Kentron sp. H]VFJ89555.1 MAG: protein of unknown function (DUF4405) [Candidatus Kentron sp. H]VFJ96250.1 MAG: protein of unknown function (DUF4405) [Candidatus Kentron sp. H]
MKYMKRSTFNFIIDAIAFGGFVFLVVTGILIRYALPHGRGRSGVIWGMDRHQWGDLHFWIALALLAIVAFHLFLHWRWVVTMVVGKVRQGWDWRALSGVVGLVGFLGLAFAPLMSGVMNGVERVQRAPPPHPYAEKSGHESEIRGSMTLREVEDSSGIPVSDLIRRLGLPPETAPDTRLRELRRTHGLSMNRVRAIVGEGARE